MENIIIATIKEWNIRNYFVLKDKFSNRYNFHLITNSQELTCELINKINPKYIFFPHWSWIIPKKIYLNYESIVFHMTDLPFGRGGSPLQNLIIRGIEDTKISAIKVSKEVDSGDIYLKESFNISIGSAEEIFIKLSKTIFENMIPKFLENELKPEKQSGDITTFKRRKKEESAILYDLNNVNSINKLYNFIRMLDGEGYPKAFIDIDNRLKIEFSEVSLKSNKLTGRFEVKDIE
jgi:methionyl-tRNA formyltransferase